MTSRDASKDELIRALREGVDGAFSGAGEIVENLLACSDGLRVGCGEESFRALAKTLDDLGHLVALVRQVAGGCGQLPEVAVPAGVFAPWERSAVLFRDMLASLERKDWIALADQIRYELGPVLEEGRQGLAALRAALG